mgnify:CR=1 FL=1
MPICLQTYTQQEHTANAILRHPFLLVQAWSEGQEEAWVQEVPYNPAQRKRKYRVINLTVDDPPEIN